MKPAENEMEVLAVNYRVAARLLGVCEKTIYQLVKDGRLRAMRVGRAVRISKDALAQFVRESEGSQQVRP